MNTTKQQSDAARAFAKRWEGRHSEEQEGRSFWIDLMQTVLGVENAVSHMQFEKPVKSRSTQRIDVWFPATKVLVEHKSSGIRLDLAMPVAGKPLPITPYGQAKDYADHMVYSEKPRWIITCNFSELWIYDMEVAENLRQPLKLSLEDLWRNCRCLNILVDSRHERQIKEEEVSVKAGQLVAEMYNMLKAQYGVHDSRTLRNLNILCVRIVFCLYAEDAGVFAEGQFHDYLSHYETDDLAERLEKLFAVLNTPDSERSPSLADRLRAFPYTNGGLFAEHIDVPRFTEPLRSLILDRASMGFNWSDISPTIFGALFESTINPETRQQGGMHYTSIENIHKVIDPLFLDDLRQELEGCLKKRQHESDTAQRQRLADFQDKLASLRFLDPACGSGNFLTETYLSLREMENTVIRSILRGQEGAHNIRLSLANPVKVSIGQFYGIEVNDFAVSVAQVALWISEAKMLARTEEIVGHSIDFLPLRSYTNIRQGNALRIDWADLLPPSQLNYIMGNPPFVGYKEKDKSQKEDLLIACQDINGNAIPNVGSLDYVCGWYYKAANYLQQNNTVKAAFVSTNSITQGEQIAIHWRCLFEQYNITIDFAYRTFVWNNEAEHNAQVHCVIVGFSTGNNNTTRHILFNEKGEASECSHINGYLLDEQDIWLTSQRKPLSAPKKVTLGVHIFDNHHFIFTKDEKDVFIEKEPRSEPWFKRWVSAGDFLYGTCRYYLDLHNCPPNELRQMTHCYDRVKMVLEYRRNNPSAKGTPLETDPFRPKQGWKADCHYIAIPNTSSENRNYLPIELMTEETVITMPDLALPMGDLYDFGILSSCVHIYWVKTVCGRLKSDYRYAHGLVYNNFPWPQPTDAQRDAIIKTAKAIIEARQMHKSSCLADLYDSVTMPSNLRQAHHANDLAVLAAYGFSPRMDESDIVSKLFALYRNIQHP